MRSSDLWYAYCRSASRRTRQMALAHEDAVEFPHTSTIGGSRQLFAYPERAPADS